MDVETVARRMVGALLDELTAQGMLDEAWYHAQSADRIIVRAELTELVQEILEEQV